MYKPTSIGGMEKKSVTVSSPFGNSNAKPLIRPEVLFSVKEDFLPQKIIAVTSFPGQKVKVEAPSDDKICSVLNVSNTDRALSDRISRIKSILLLWSGDNAPVADFACLEQMNAAKLAKEFLVLSKHSVISNLTDLIAMSIYRMEKMLDYLSPKSGLSKLFGNDRQNTAEYGASLRDLESYVDKAGQQIPELDLYTKSLSSFLVKTQRIMLSIDDLMDANQVLAAVAETDAKRNTLEERLQSLSKTKMTLFQTVKLVEQSVQQCNKLKSIIMDYVLTGIPGWVTISSLQLIQDESNRIVSRNKLEELFTNLKQGA